MNNLKEFRKLPDLKELAGEVKAARAVEGVSQKKLADIVGCSHVSILNLEKGNGKINISTAWKILDALGLIGKNNDYTL